MRFYPLRLLTQRHARRDLYRSRLPGPQPRVPTGATVVEFAIVTPLVFLLFFALIEFGRLVMVQQAVTHAAREGCRTAALITTREASEVEQVVRKQLQSAVPRASDPSTVGVTITPADLSSVPRGGELSVGVNVRFSKVSWLTGRLCSTMGDPVIRARFTQTRE